MNDDLFDRAESLGGVPILGLLPHSPAALAGLRVGDVLLEIDGKGVSNLRDYIDARRGATERVMRLKVVRAGVLIDIELDLDHGAHRPDEATAMGVLRQVFAPEESNQNAPTWS